MHTSRVGANNNLKAKWPIGNDRVGANIIDAIYCDVFHFILSILGRVPTLGYCVFRYASGGKLPSMYLRLGSSYLFLRCDVCQLPVSPVSRLHPERLCTKDARLKSVFLIRSIAYQALASWLRLGGLVSCVALF